MFGCQYEERRLELMSIDFKNLKANRLKLYTKHILIGFLLYIIIVIHIISKIFAVKR